MAEVSGAASSADRIGRVASLAGRWRCIDRKACGAHGRHGGHRYPSTSLVEEIAGLDAEIGEAPLDDAVIALEAWIEGISGPRARFETAQVDLPKRRLELQQINVRLEAILAEIGQGRDRHRKDC